MLLKSSCAQRSVLQSAYCWCDKWRCLLDGPALRQCLLSSAWRSEEALTGKPGKVCFASDYNHVNSRQNLAIVPLKFGLNISNIFGNDR